MREREVEEKEIDLQVTWSERTVHSTGKIKREEILDELNRVTEWNAQRIRRRWRLYALTYISILVLDASKLPSFRLYFLLLLSSHKTLISGDEWPCRESAGERTPASGERYKISHATWMWLQLFLSASLSTSQQLDLRVDIALATVLSEWVSVREIVEK